MSCRGSGRGLFWGIIRALIWRCEENKESRRQDSWRLRRDSNPAHPEYKSEAFTAWTSLLGVVCCCSRYWYYNVPSVHSAARDLEWWVLWSVWKLTFMLPVCFALSKRHPIALQNKWNTVC